MNVFSKIANALGNEPVAVQTAVLAGLELAGAIRSHHVYGGVVTAFLLAVIGLFTRAQVTPTQPSESTDSGD